MYNIYSREACCGCAVSKLIGLMVGTAAAIAGGAALVEAPILSVLVGSSVGALVYWSAVFWLGLLQVEEVEQLVQSLPGAFRQMGVKVFRYLEPVLLRLRPTVLN